MELLFATQNQNKLIEIQNILGNAFKLLSLNDVFINTEIPENQDTIKGNALEKARFIFEKTNKNCFADDTGLEVFALNGEPGVNSARYAGLDKNSDNNISLLLSKLKGKNNRNARFNTIIALILDNNEYLFEGLINGIIIDIKKGKHGFGYDPVFIPNGYNITFAEMPLEEKNKISHRAIAFNKLKNFLNNYNK